MRIEGERESNNVEDRRGGGGGMMGGKRGIGIGSIVIAAIAYFVFGVNPMTTLSVVGGGGSTPTQQAPVAANSNDPMTKFAKVVMAQTEDAWTQVFKEQGKTYVPTKLRIFSGRTDTACGPGDTAAGPFYCPADQAVYIDPQFYVTLSKQLGASGDFARAYVIGHEVGHHVQNQLGIMDKMEQAKQRNPKMANQLSVRLELQADCFAGVWARRTENSRKVLEPGDLQEAMVAAAAVGAPKALPTAHPSSA
jgi:predicted metalloprotease